MVRKMQCCLKAEQCPQSFSTAKIISVLLTIINVSVENNLNAVLEHIT